MGSNIEKLEELPDIDLLADEGITLEGIMEEMIADYQSAYEELTGEEKTLYPADEQRLMINVIAGQIFQAYEFAQERFRENFIRYMNDDELLHWGSNIGYEVPEEKPAETTLEFNINDPLSFDVIIPEGTRVTSGDDVYFQINNETVIPAGELTATVGAVCTESGSVGNDYAPGQINIIADPFPYMGAAENIVTSYGGEDTPTGDILREQIYIHPSTYSTAGPKDAYIALIKGYSAEITSVSVVTDTSATVNIYVLLEGGILPDAQYLSELSEYMGSEKCVPDTDQFIIQAPSTVDYQLDLTYYIETADRDNEKAIQESVEEAIEAYVTYQGGEIGMDIDTGVLIEYVRAAGAKRVEVRSPASYQKMEQDQVAVCNAKNIVYGGLEGSL